MSVGFVVEPGPTKPKPCQHRDNWAMEVHGDYLFRFCYTCGTTWMLTSITEGFAWDKIVEPEELDDVAGVGKTVLTVPSGEADGGVQRKPRKARRPRQSVQDMPRRVELKPEAEGSEEAMG